MFDPGQPITSGDLIEDADGAPLPHELQTGGTIWLTVRDALLFAVTVNEANRETDAIVRALAPVLWPLLPSNDERSMTCAKPTMSHCVCSVKGEHEVHACTEPSALAGRDFCLGQWRTDGTVVRYPTGAWTEDEAREHGRLLRAGQPLPEVIAVRGEV